MSTETTKRSDEELLESYKSGSVQDFRELLSRYHQPLFNYLYRLLRDRHAAEDMFQEVFLSIHRSLKTFDFSRKFKPWVYAIATNLARDEMRRNKTAAMTVIDTGASGEDDYGLRDILASDEQSPDEKMRLDEQKVFIRETLDAMPEHLRTVLILYHYQEMKYREIAETLGVPIGTVKSRLHAALTQIAKSFEKKFNQGTHEIKPDSKQAFENKQGSTYDKR